MFDGTVKHVSDGCRGTKIFGVCGQVVTLSSLCTGLVQLGPGVSSHNEETAAYSSDH